MWNPPEALPLTDEQRRTLEAWVAARTTPQRLAFRARIILLASTGASNRHIAHQVQTSRPTVILWRQRFGAGGLAALTEDAPGRGRKPQLSRTKVQQIVDATLQTPPPAATHWSTRTLAQAQGVSPATIQRIWDAHGAAAPPDDPHVQAVHRSAVRRETDGRRGAVSEPAGEGAGAVCR